MAHYVARILHLRPNDILDGWCTPELVVAYGHYANEDSLKNYNEWKSLDQKSRAKMPRPKEYAVEFYSLTEDE